LYGTKYFKYNDVPSPDDEKGLSMDVLLGMVYIGLIE